MVQDSELTPDEMRQVEEAEEKLDRWLKENFVANLKEIVVGIEILPQRIRNEIVRRYKESKWGTMTDVDWNNRAFRLRK